MKPEVVGRTVVVTGGAGFIGSHIAEAFLPDNTVVVLDNCSTGSVDKVPSGAEFVEGDIRDATIVDECLAGADIVFHEAAQVSVQQSVEDPRPSTQKNVGGTLNVLEAARRADARVVGTSSCVIYGHPEAVPIAETAPRTPISPYAIDKLWADHYLRAYHELYGLETVALRYFNVYGPRLSGGAYSGVISAFLEQAKRDDPITVEGTGTQTRDFVHVDDIVTANVAAATTTAVGEAYNVGTGTETTINELAAVIRRTLDSDSEILQADPRPAEIERSRADISKARRLLGYEPEVDIETGIQSMI
jgi:UDP-glucose 4-epimerase